MTGAELEVMRVVTSQHSIVYRGRLADCSLETV